MIRSIVNRMLRSKNNAVPAPVKVRSSIEVWFNTLHVGTLTRDEGLWHFCYSTAFKQQSEVAPITDFPDRDRDYTSKNLWPFFALRIPSINQPQVRDYLKEHNPSEEMLLNRFGRSSASNPFTLAST
jgi:HipA-like protein